MVEVSASNASRIAAHAIQPKAAWPSRRTSGRPGGTTAGRGRAWGSARPTSVAQARIRSGLRQSPARVLAIAWAV